MAAEKEIIEYEVDTNADEAGEKFVRLQTRIRQTRIELQKAAEAGDTVKFNKLKGQLDDLEDSLEVVTIGQKKFGDALATVPGPAGLVGKAIQGLDSAFKFLIANPIVAVIAGIAGALLTMKKALESTKEGQETLNRVSQAFSKILGPLLALIEKVAVPVFEGFAKAIEFVASGFNKFAKFLGISESKIKEATLSVDKVQQEANKKEEERQKEAQQKREQAEKERLAKQKQAAEERKRLREQEQKELVDGEKQAFLAILGEREKEEYEVREKYAKLIWLATKYKQDTTLLTEAQKKELADIAKKYDDKELEKANKDKEEKFKAAQEAYKFEYEQLQKVKALDEQRADSVRKQNEIIAQSWINLGNNISGVLGSLAQTFQGNEALQKIFAVTQVAVNTASSIGSILLSGKAQQAEYDKAIAAGNASIALGATTAFIPGAQLLAAGQLASGKAAVAAGIAGKAKSKISTTAQVIAAGVAGAAQIAAILSAKKSATGPTGVGGTEVGVSATPAFNASVSVPAPVIGATQATTSGTLATTIAGAVQAGNSKSRPIQAYVVGDQVTTQQQLDRRISVAAKMGG